MNVVNQDVEEGDTPIINSRYSIVMATAKRARQIVDGDEPMIGDAEGMKPLSIAVKELEQSKLQILPQDEREAEELEEEEVREAKALEATLGGEEGTSDNADEAAETLAAPSEDESPVIED
jgi:DNA-directed RNA polymerase subunit omega